VACQLTVLGLIVPRRMQRLLLLVAHSLNHRLARETTAPMTSDRIAAGSGIVHAHLYFLNVDPDLGVAVLTAEPRNKPWPPGEDGRAGAAGTLFLSIRKTTCSCSAWCRHTCTAETMHVPRLAQGRCDEKRATELQVMSRAANQTTPV